MRAKAAIESAGKDRENIVITEIPYQVNKSRLIERIAELVQTKKIEGISDVRDESDREGMRIVIEVKRGEEPKIILNHLYKLTQMQESFGMILLAIVNGQPRELGLIAAAASCSSSTASKWCGGARNSSCARPKSANTSCSAITSRSITSTTSSRSFADRPAGRTRARICTTSLKTRKSRS